MKNDRKERKHGLIKSLKRLKTKGLTDFFKKIEVYLLVLKLLIILVPIIVSPAQQNSYADGIIIITTNYDVNNFITVESD